MEIMFNNQYYNIKTDDVRVISMKLNRNNEVGFTSSKIDQNDWKILETIKYKY